MRLLTIAKHEDRVLIPRIHEPNQMWTETEESWSTSASSPDTDTAEDRDPGSYKVGVTSDVHCSTHLHVLLTNTCACHIQHTHHRV